MEQHSLVVASVGGHPPAIPALTSEQRSQLSHQVKSISEILQPARVRGPELDVAIGSMFAVMNVYTGDDAKLKMQVADWCEAVGEYPLFAIRKAAKWAVTGREKLPSVSAFRPSGRPFHLEDGDQLPAPERERGPPFGPLPIINL
ncbi:hypothetical protein ACVIGA_000616 [Bradyrhizobium sp. USDA 3240]